MSPAQCLAHSGCTINWSSLPPPTGSQLDAAAPVALNYADNLQVVDRVGGVESKRSLTQPISARGWWSWTPTKPMAGCADSESALPLGALATVVVASVRGGGAGPNSLGHAPEAEPHWGPAAATEGGAGLARMSATEPQVAAGAGLGPSSGGECCPQTPTNPPWPSQPRVRTHRAPPSWQPWGAKTWWGLGRWRTGVRWAARWAPRPLPGGN